MEIGNASKAFCSFCEASDRSTVPLTGQWFCFLWILITDWPIHLNEPASRVVWLVERFSDVIMNPTNERVHVHHFRHVIRLREETLAPVKSVVRQSSVAGIRTRVKSPLTET